MDVSAFFKIINNKKGLTFISPFLEATTRFELVIRVLQTHALPLGYVALIQYIITNIEIFVNTLIK